MTLTEYGILSDIEKAQYLKRAGVPGHYKYWYSQPKKKEVKRFYQEFGKEVKNGTSISETIDDVLKQGGYSTGVITAQLPFIDFNEKTKKTFFVKDSKGNKKTMKNKIDIVSGNEKYGLVHSLIRHYAENSDYSSISEFINSLSNSLKEISENKAELVEANPKKQRIVFLDSKKNKLTFFYLNKKDSKGNMMMSPMFLTSFDSSKEKSSKIRSDEERDKKLIEIRKYINKGTH